MTTLVVKEGLVEMALAVLKRLGSATTDQRLVVPVASVPTRCVGPTVTPRQNVAVTHQHLERSVL